MKRILILCLSALILAGCAGLKKEVAKQSVEIAEKTAEIQRLQKKIDSITSVKEAEIRRLEQMKQRTEWVYTAPKTITKTDSVTKRLPVFMEMNGRMIDVSLLPEGSSLSTVNEVERNVENYQKTIENLHRKVTELNSELSKKAKIEYRDKIVEKRVERQSVQWIFIFSAFVIGLVFPELFKFILNLIKKLIKPI